MEPKRDIFEELIKETLRDTAPEPSENVWKGISRQMAWKEFVRFDFTNFTSNIYQIVAVTMVGISLTAVLVTTLIQPTEKEKNIKEQPRQEMTDKSLEQHFEKAKPTDQRIVQPAIPASPIPSQRITIQGKIESEVVPESPNPKISRETIDFRPSAISSIIGIKFGNIISRGGKAIMPAPLRGEEKAKWQIAAGANWTWNRMQIPSTPDNFRYDFNTLGLHANASKGRFRVGAGFSYQRLFDPIPYQVNYKTYDSTGFIINVHYYMPDPNNPDMVILITSKETIYDSVAHSITTLTTGTYDYLTLPLSTGYEILRIRNLSVFLDGIATLQFLLRKKEPAPAFYNPLKSSLTIEATLPRRKNFLIDLGASISLEYKLFNRVRLVAGPTMRWWLQPLSDAPQSGKPSAWGFNAGLEYDF